MKKLLIILSCIGIYYFLTHVNDETITKKTLTINNCKANYVHFKNDNIIKIAETGGHAPNNIMELGHAKIEIGKCLCDTYLNTKSAADSIEIIKILSSEEYTYMKNFLFEYSFEDFQTDTLNVASACKNKDKYFGKVLMD